MLYLYDYKTEDVDKILVRVLGGFITEQQFIKDDIVVKKVSYGWEIMDGRLSKCHGPEGGVIIVPPCLGSSNSVQCVGINAFSEVKPDKVILLNTGRVTLEKDSLVDVKEVIAHSYLKRSEIPANCKPLGRVLEDVRS